MFVIYKKTKKIKKILKKGVDRRGGIVVLYSSAQEKGPGRAAERGSEGYRKGPGRAPERARES